MEQQTQQKETTQSKISTNADAVFTDQMQNKEDQPKKEEMLNVLDSEKGLYEENDAKPQSETDENTHQEAMEEDEKTDDYGNPVSKSKMYTEEEVQRMIRDRLKRGEAARQAEQKVEPQHQETQPQEGNWEEELEGFVEKTINKLSTKQQQKAAELQEKKQQQEFEDKFTNGMSKYKDFVDVVKDKPITDMMMRGTRHMNDPAAFIYAASKMYPKDLDRISKIADPYAQIAEVGRLEERMRKVRSGTNAPRPGSETKGDVENRQNYRKSIDDLINQDASKKFRRR